MAVATTMYHTGIDPLTMKPVYTARDLREKRMMKALLFYWDEAEWPLAREALRRVGRGDLIGARARATRVMRPRYLSRASMHAPA